MYKKIIIIIGLLLLASSASASDDWWNTSYQYRVPVVLTGNTSGAQTNYQLMLNVSYNSNMQVDFDDIRFTDDSGNLQNAWLESKTDDSWADIWVNFTTTPDNGATQTYYMYYGKVDAASNWDIDTTFLLGDDFTESSLDTNKWSEELEGTGASVNISNGECELHVPDDQICSANIKSVATFTNNIVIETKRKCPDDVEYFYLSLGSGSICDLNGGSSDWWHTTLFSSYFWEYADLSDADQQHIVKMPSSGSGTNLLTGDFTIDVSTYKIFEYRYDDTGNIVGLIDDIEKISTTDTDYLSDNKNILITQGAYSDSGRGAPSFLDWVFVRKYAANPPTYGFGSEEEYTLPAASETPTPTPTPLEEITSSNYVIQNQTLYITKPCDLQYKITSNSFVYGGLRNINTVICDNNNTVISGWFKISTDNEYNADYTFLINVNDTSYESKIITIKQEQVDSSIISKTYRRSLIIDGYEIYSYNTTVYIVSILPNPIYFYFNLEDRIIQFGDKQFNNQTLVFNQLNFDDQYEFMNNASSDTVVMKFKAINPKQKSGAELKGLTGILLNALSKIPFIGKSFKNVLYYPLFFIQTIFDFVFTFLDLIVNDWWYGLMLMEIVCIFAASRNKGYANVMEVYIDTHVKIIKFIYEWIILKTINLIITIVVTIKDMIKWW